MDFSHIFFTFSLKMLMLYNTRKRQVNATLASRDKKGSKLKKKIKDFRLEFDNIWIQNIKDIDTKLKFV